MSEQTKAINKNVGQVGSLTGLSRILGLLREVLTSRLIGAGLEQSAFVFAFTIPNLFRKLFGEGALSSAFIPVFTETLEKQNLVEAEKLARAIASMVFMLLAILCAIGMVAVSFVLPSLDPAGRMAVMLRLTRIMLPYAVMICVAAFGMGVLNAFGRFGKAAFAPAILNVVWIATLAALFFFPELSLYERVSAVSWSVLVSGFLQMVFLLHAVRRNGMKLNLTFSGWRNENVLKVWRNTMVGAIGMGAVQINLILDNALALWAAPWAAASISYAERLVYLPLGLFATAFATVLLPTLSGAFARDELGRAKLTLVQSTEDVLLLTIPASFGLFLLAPDITQLVYEGGKFTPADTVHVSRALLFYAPGLLIFSVNKIILPWFYAQKDMKTPLRVSLVMVGANAVLNILLVLTLPVEWKHAGIAGSTVLCALVACIVLAWKAHLANGLMGFGRLVGPCVKMGLSALLMGAAVLATRYAVLGVLGEGRIALLMAVVSAMAVAAIVYGVAVWRLCPVASRRVLMLKARHGT